MTIHRPLSVIEDGGLTALTPMRRPVQNVTSDPAVLQAVRDALLDQLPADLLDPVAPARRRDPEVLRVLRNLIGAQIEQGYGPLRGLPTDESSLLNLFHESLGWGPAQPYLDDERVQELKIIGDRIMIQEEGADFVLVPERFADPRQALDRALLLAARLNVPLDRSRPQDTLPLAHGTRMHVTIPPCTPEHSALICIRRGRRTAWSLDDIARRGAANSEVFALLHLLVRAGCSFLIAGETGSGKTALLEAIVNSWPGEPHVITIEDSTLEINVRHQAWTRELVQSAVEQSAFGRAAREVLRQTPSLVAPGETRAEEAGAILAVAVSGHAVVTTLHARSALRAVQRFADCAAMPGAYIYAGRRANALEDACDNFQVVIHLDNLAGQRIVNEIILLDGAEEHAGRLCPRARRLAWFEPGIGGEPAWHVAAHVNGNYLEWEGIDQTPETLMRRLQRLGAVSQVRAVATTRATVAEAIARAELAIHAGQAEQALAILRRAWAERHDEQLLQAARRALDLDPTLARKMASASSAAAEQISDALHSRHWPLAAAALETVGADLALRAAYTPAGGWTDLETALARGLAADQAAHTVTDQARIALAQGRARDAADILAPHDPQALSPARAMSLLQARRAALETLCATGEISVDALLPVDAAITALERSDRSSDELANHPS